ncbi:MAG: NAD(P)/FAD-dependent oxidoreductase [Candidatus Ventricola sp.]
MHCIILGGGASGLAACASLQQAGVRVTLVERLDRVGKKLLSTGNGRCNLSNVLMEPSLYGVAAPFVSRVYARTPPEEVLSFLASLGLMTACEEGRLYPRTRMAASVLDVLRAGCAGAEILTGCQAEALTPSRRGGWSVSLSDGRGLFAPVVLSCMGGSAAPHLGTDGAGARLLGALGHSVTAQLPALVQLRCTHPALRSLKGIRVQAALTLLVDGQAAAREEGELLFADYGVSGVCVFQLSRHAARALDAGRRVSLRLHLLPEISGEALPGWLDARIAAQPGYDAQALFTGVFPRLLTQALLRQAGVAPDAQASRLTAAERQALAEAVCAFPLSVTGTQGFASAQVTAGGVPLDEVDPDTMASRLFDGLYLAGELLDVDGPCGGYNLHFAFASGLTAAKAILARLAG